MAKVDIVIPCYNYGRFLEQCVRSVLAQSVRDLRVLVIDDASADESVAVAERLASEDSRVALVAHRVNKGHIDTYNEGIEWASSEYFLLLSADDMLAPGALERAVEVMDANPDIVLTYGDFVNWRDTTPLPVLPPLAGYSWARHELLLAMCHSAGNPVPTPTAIVRTSAQKAVGGYRKSLPHAGDMEMWLRFAANGAVARIDAIQAIYRRHTAAMSNAYFAQMVRDYRQRQLAFDFFFEEYGGGLPDSRILLRAAHLGLATDVVSHSVRLMRKGQVKDGFALMRYAMSLDPRVCYRLPLWSLLKPPGPEGRSRLMAMTRDVATRLSSFGGGAVRSPR